MPRTTVTLALFSESTLDDLTFDVEYEPNPDPDDGPPTFSISSTQVSGPIVHPSHMQEIAEAIASSVRSHYFRNKLN